ncbi:hypothetical protein CHRYSEOSP005_24710 [Chryseobacterium sp. Alg-005]
MCNYIIQNLIFLFLVFLYIYFILNFKFRKTDFNYKDYIKKRKRQSSLSWLLDINGWQAAIFSIIFTIVYFFLKRGVLTDILSIFGITIC